MAVVRRTQARTVPALLGEAFSLHQAGRLDEAEKLYLQILQAEPAHFDGRHLLGVIFQQRGDHVRALRHIELALVHIPANAMALNNRGVSLKALGRFDEALASYDGALAVQRDFADALLNRGLVLAQLGRPDEALASFDRAVAARPDFAAAFLNRGNLQKALGRFDEALASYDRALALRPDFAEVHCNRANLLLGLNRPDEALASADRAVTSRPDFAEAHANRGNVLHAIGRDPEALASYERALALRSDFAEVLFNRGNVLQDLQRNEEALSSYDCAVAARPGHAEAYFNRGNLLHGLQRFDDAVASYDRAILLRPEHAEALANRGASLHELGRFGDALSSYRSAVAARPDFADAHYNAGMASLVTGDYRSGWKQHEWRWRTALFATGRRDLGKPLWLGSDDIAGKTILLHAEQGLGDTIQFCRYVPLVVACGAHVILEVQKPLVTLMESLGCAVRIIGRGDVLPDFDLHCPLLSLPLACGTELATIPAAMPYLAARDAKIGLWRARLGERGKLRIGLVWAGNPRKQLPNAHRIDAQRSLALERLAPLFEVAGCDFYSLQKGEDAVRRLRESPLRGRMIDHADELRDFSDTAALIEQLDLVISVDTSVAHLAGALDKPFWLLNRHNTCWRWLVGRDDSPWYPTARLFRQEADRDWDRVIARVGDALREHAARRS